MIRLGLIGDNIRASRAPTLHRVAGTLCGLDVRYDLLVPAELGLDFGSVLARCREQGYRGVNVTYPYKERVLAALQIADEQVRAIGACNTVLLDRDPPSGFNTDCSGFAKAYREAFGEASAGAVAIVGAGGVGRAIAFALAGLGAIDIRLFDRDRARADGLAGQLSAFAPGISVCVATTVEEAVSGADGLVNGTPIGMVGYPGTAVPEQLMPGCRWAFDAVYTPRETEFLDGARRAGLQVIDGYELFLHQGVDAFRIFTGRDVDPSVLREAIAAAHDEEVRK